MAFPEDKDWCRGFFPVHQNVLQRAVHANNGLCFPLHNIWTDLNSHVIDVSLGFLHFTGYSKNEMLGRSCNFLQGKDTNPDDVHDIRMAVKKNQRVCVVILNYCKDGSPFWNVLSIVPVVRGFRNRREVIAFSSEIVGLPIPPCMQQKPKLCLEDALALINVFSSVPRSIHSSLDITETSFSGQKRQSYLFKHINYTELPAPGPSANVVTYDFIAETSLPTEKGTYRVRAYRDSASGAEPLAIIHGDVSGKDSVVCRVHDQCVTSEVFGSLRCDCKQQLDYALNYIKDACPGIVLYLPQEGRGIGIANKIAAYAVQEIGFDTVEANRHLGFPDDARSYRAVRDILRDLKINSVKLMTNNPRKIKCLKELGVKVVGRINCVCEPKSTFSFNYVKAKAEKMGHMIDISRFQG